MFCEFCFFGTVVASPACVPQKPGVRQTTGTVVLVVEVLVLVELVLVLVDVLVELVLVDVLVLLVLVLVDVLVELVLVDVEVLVELVLVEVLVLVDVDVVPQLLVHESELLALPSSQASPEPTCTMPSPQIVHGLAEPTGRHVWPLSGQPTCSPVGPHGSPPTAGQHCSPSQVSNDSFTIPSPHTAGKFSTALPPAVPVAHGVPAGCSHASRSSPSVSARVKNWPLAGLETGVVAVTWMVTSVTTPLAGSVTPDVMVISTVLPLGSLGSSEQSSTPAAILSHELNVSVPCNSDEHREFAHASFTCVVPVKVAGTGFVFGGSVFELVFVILTSLVIAWLITSVESLGKIELAPLACTPACAGSANTKPSATAARTW
jgi:hypothetical protein